MLRCIKQKSSKDKTPPTSISIERGYSTLPHIFNQSGNEENTSKRTSPFSSNRLTKWIIEKKSATITAGCTISSENVTKTKLMPFTFLRTLSLGSLFLHSRKRQKEDLTTTYSPVRLLPDVELHTLSDASQVNLHKRQNKVGIAPSEESLTPTGDETYHLQLTQLSKRELYLEKLAGDAYNCSRDKTPTDERSQIVTGEKYLKKYPNDQHDSGRSSTSESEVSVASEEPKKKTDMNGLPITLEKHLTVLHKRVSLTIDIPDQQMNKPIVNDEFLCDDEKIEYQYSIVKQKQPDVIRTFLRAARVGNLDKLLETLNKVTDINVSNNNGLNALHLACKEGRTEVVRELLSRGASVHLATRKGNSALHIASLGGHLDIVRLLISHGADINARSQNGFTPLYMSAQENHVEIVQLLLDKSANQALSTKDGFTPLAVALQQGNDRVVNLLLERDSRGKSRLPALHIAAKKDDVHAANLLLNNSEINVDHTSTNYVTPLHVAAKWGKNKIIEELILAGAEVNPRTRDGLTPLHCASRAGQADTVEYLLKRGADQFLKTKNDLTPLHMAAQCVHESVIRLLLKSGLNPNDVTMVSFSCYRKIITLEAYSVRNHLTPTNDYLTPLHVAAHCGNVNVARILLDSRCNVNARALNGFTALHIACKKSRVEMAYLLIKYGALMEAATETGLTPLHVASFVGCTDIVSLLLQIGTNVNQTTLRSETALHLAARNRQLETIKTLLKYRANLNCCTQDNQTPLHVAVRTKYLPVVELLLNAGCNPNIMTKDNYTPIHIAIKEDSDDIIKKLIEHGANPEVRTKKGFTPLHLAAKYGSYKACHLLINQTKSNPNAVGRNGFTPVHVATYYNNVEILNELIEFGGDVNQPIRNGFTPLHLAAKRNQLDSIRLLASKGAIIDKGSRNGYTPLHLASQDGRLEVVKLLVEEYRAQVDTPAKDGLTALHLAVQEDKVNVAKYLLDAGASIDKKTLKAGFTPLHSSSYRGQLGSVRLLLSCIPECELLRVINTLTYMGSTALHLAAQQGHLQVALKLVQMGADPNICNAQGLTAAELAQRQHYLNLFETLQKITNGISGKFSPTSGRTDGNADSVGSLMPLEKAEFMTDYMISDSEDEASRNVTIYSGLNGSIPEEHAKPMLSGKNDQVLTSQQLVRLPADKSSPVDLSEWDFDGDNDHSTKNLVKSGFLISFIIDARGGLVEARRQPDLRFFVPPNAPSEPLRVICRLLRPETIDNPPVFDYGDCLACRIIEMNPKQMRFALPILIEVPHIASIRGREREIIVIRSETGNSWKEHTLVATEQAVNDSMSEAFDSSDLNASIFNKHIHRILTYDFPQYFALVSRFRQERVFIGSDGGLIISTVVPQVQAVFPPGSLQKRVKVGLQVQPISDDIISRVAGNHVCVSPVVSIEPRRRKFHKPITLTIPLPRQSAKTSSDTIGSLSKVRLLCSLSSGKNAVVWEDITNSTPMTHHKDCISFTTTVSARLWLVDCLTGNSVTDIATRIYNESIEPPIYGRFVIYARYSIDVDIEEKLKTSMIITRNIQDMKRRFLLPRRCASEYAHIRCSFLTDDNVDKSLGCLEHYNQVAISPLVEIQQNKPIWIEVIGNLVPVLRSGEQLNFTVRPFYENRVTFPVRLRDVLDHEPDAKAVTGRIAFMREPRNTKTIIDVTNAQFYTPISLLEFKLPNPDDMVMTSTTDLGIVEPSERDRQTLSFETNNDWRRRQDMKMIDRIPLDNFPPSSELATESQRAENMNTLWQHKTASPGLTNKDTLDMKFQEIKELREHYIDPILSWSENAFFSSDEGVSIISAYGATDSIQKQKGNTVEHSQLTDPAEIIDDLAEQMTFDREAQITPVLNDIQLVKATPMVTLVQTNPVNGKVKHAMSGSIDKLNAEFIMTNISSAGEAFGASLSQEINEAFKELVPIRRSPKNSSLITIEVEQVEETLQNGTVVTKTTESKETILSVTPDEWEQGVQDATDSGGLVIEKPDVITQVS
ncbi:Ankyrin-3 [Schistosoma japonicum]|nr:Ankyrin-3 [Schistosoma japonicum]